MPANAGDHGHGPLLRSAAGQSAYKSLWIDRPTVFEHFEMQMRPGGTTGRAHPRNRLTFVHLVAHFNQQAGVVGVTGYIAVAMVDLHHPTVSRTVSSPRDDTGRYRPCLGTRRRGKINTAVIGHPAGKRIGA